MSFFTGKWIVDIKGAPDRSFEISIVREDNIHGFRSYGWFKDGEKLYVSGSGGPCNDRVPQFVWDRLVGIAEEYAAHMNSLEPPQ